MHSSRKSIGPFPWAWLVALAVGCSGDGLLTSAGSVSCDGKPLESGVISFHPLEGGLAPHGGQIVAGRFRLRARPGRYRVEIRATRPKPGAPELTPGMRPYEQYLPPRYNDATKLEAEVSPAVPNEFSFALEADLSAD